jgi:hypothetical protein
VIKLWPSLQKIRFFIENLTTLSLKKRLSYTSLGGVVTKHRLIGHKVCGFESRLVRPLFAQSKNFCIMQTFFTLKHNIKNSTILCGQNQKIPSYLSFSCRKTPEYKKLAYLEHFLTIRKNF